MRYYILVPSSSPGIPPYVLAETGRESFDAGSLRDSSLASAVAGDEAQILTEDELLSQPGGRAALEAWRSGDDRSFDRDTDHLGTSGEGREARRGLRAVGPDERAPRRGEGAA